jgi:hypothetical protein
MMKDSIAMTSLSLVTLPEDNYKWCAALFFGLSLLAIVMFPATMPKFKGGQKIFSNSAIF